MPSPWLRWLVGDYGDDDNHVGVVEEKPERTTSLYRVLNATLTFNSLGHFMKYNMF